MAILAAREKVYLAAKARHPERWSSEVKSMNPVGGVWLNPDNLIQHIDETEEQVA